MRIPERLSLLAMLFVGLLVGRGLEPAAASSRLARARAAAGWPVPLEHVSPLPLSVRVPVGRELPAVYFWLAAQPGVARYAEVPTHGESLVRKETLEMYFSTAQLQARSSTATRPTPRCSPGC